MYNFLKKTQNRTNFSIFILISISLFFPISSAYDAPTIVFLSEPSGADIYVTTGGMNELVWGKTPLYQMGCGPGPYLVKYKKEGYQDYVTSFTLTTEKSSIQLAATLNPLSIPIPVESTHIPTIIQTLITASPMATPSTILPISTITTPQITLEIIPPTPSQTPIPAPVTIVTTKKISTPSTAITPEITRATVAPTRVDVHTSETPIPKSPKSPLGIELIIISVAGAFLIAGMRQ